ncbi:hypothetical protein F5Y16DRAFT_408073 [Xylariaceae sp. FL0255]|nr:hypothetical protein F5Y16DRAFT_408073 [Xylariaceae sp. FL0255]
MGDKDAKRKASGDLSSFTTPKRPRHVDTEARLLNNVSNLLKHYATPVREKVKNPLPGSDDASAIGQGSSAFITPPQRDISRNIERLGDYQNSLAILSGLNSIIQDQLPEMPAAYISRQIYDPSHFTIAIVKQPFQVVGGLTYRPFKERKFAEIVFCAIAKGQQVKGYGGHLMSHLKDYVKASSEVMDFLTYADNNAIGYFKKQGFTKDITLPKAVWAGYIKDYIGGTLMQCTMVPRIRYLAADQMLQHQKESILAKIRAMSASSNVVHQPPAQWKNGVVTPIDPLSVPAIPRQSRHPPHYKDLLQLLSNLQNNKSAWPFLQPVDKNIVPDYYDVIHNPMDLSTMETKLEAGQYTTPADFISDARLIFSNCRFYNAEGTVYRQAANKMDKYLLAQVKAFPEWQLEP